MPPEESWRLFFAIEFPEEVREQAFQLGRRLAREAGRVVKWVEVENLHVTLKFIGGVPVGRVAEVAEVGRLAAKAGRPVALRLGGAGCFPSARSPRVLWAGVDGEIEPLASVASELDRLLDEGGFAKPESRAFTPHLTLGRVRRGARVRDMTGIVAEVAEVEVGRVRLDDFVLMRSHLSFHGPTYEVVERFELG